MSCTKGEKFNWTNKKECKSHLLACNWFLNSKKNNPNCWMDDAASYFSAISASYSELCLTRKMTKRHGLSDCRLTDWHAVCQTKWIFSAIQELFWKDQELFQKDEELFKNAEGLFSDTSASFCMPNWQSLLNGIVGVCCFSFTSSKKKFFFYLSLSFSFILLYFTFLYFIYYVWGCVDFQGVTMIIFRVYPLNRLYLLHNQVEIIVIIWNFYVVNLCLAYLFDAIKW